MYWPFLDMLQLGLIVGFDPINLQILFRYQKKPCLKNSTVNNLYDSYVLIKFCLFFFCIISNNHRPKSNNTKKFMYNIFCRGSIYNTFQIELTLG